MEGKMGKNWPWIQKEEQGAKVCYGHVLCKTKSNLSLRIFGNFPDLRCLALKFKMRFCWNLWVTNTFMALKKMLKKEKNENSLSRSMLVKRGKVCKRK